MFEERKVENSGIYAQEKLEELTPEVGTSVGFYLVETPMITGDDGQFMVCNGLQLNLSAKTVEELVDTATPVSFIPKSILQGDIEEGNWNVGQVARLENHIRKGDTYKGKKVKYFHWNIYIQNVPNDVIKQLKAKVDELEGKLPTEAAKTDSTPAVKKPKI
jgi:hypothetical protein